MSLTRADFHQQNQASAQVEARRLFEQKTVLRGAWLNWVASQLYALRPAEYASMVRRELMHLQDVSEN
ncbi:hypothetical protein [Pseudomonas izuensis]|uniref:hypothetical protein n=1 Tax=Pseudomonas izuensis TaxID=2684212 RepID=UPI001356BD48|nr:hypothetical protein [Pseudomonas izuensis]